MNKDPITIETTVNAPLATVWDCWTRPEHITGWAFASDDWEAPSAENDLLVGGRFKTVMAAKDKSASFDMTGIYTAVIEQQLIEYDMDEAGRHVKAVFQETPDGVLITESFDPEDENSRDMQRAGWQSIMDNFKKYAESHVSAD